MPPDTAGSLIRRHFSPRSLRHQLSADPDGLAAGKIDLLTVLMHELGHVMGLDHVSSAVDSIRLMAGSIDPGIRRLPSSLDLGPVSSTPGGKNRDILHCGPSLERRLSRVRFASVARGGVWLRLGR